MRVSILFDPIDYPHRINVGSEENWYATSKRKYRAGTHADYGGPMTKNELSITKKYWAIKNLCSSFRHVIFDEKTLWEPLYYVLLKARRNVYFGNAIMKAFKANLGTIVFVKFLCRLPKHLQAQIENVIFEQKQKRGRTLKGKLENEEYNTTKICFCSKVLHFEFYKIHLY